MDMIKNKKGFIGMWGDVIKGFVVGLLVGIIGMIVLLWINVVPPLTSMICG